MTMVPSQNGKQQNINRSGDFVIYGNTTTSSAMNQVIEVEGGYNCLLGSDFVVRRHVMADAEESSRHNNNNNNNEEAEPGGCGSTSKEEEVEGAKNNINNNNWLQLSIGLTSTKQDSDRTVPTTTGSGLVELDLLPSRRSFDQPPAFFPVVASGRGGGPSFGGSSSLLFEHQTTSSSSMSMSTASGPITSTFGHQEMMNWAFGPLLTHSMPIMPSSSSFTPLPPPSSSSSSSQSCYSPLRPPLGSYFPTPFHHFPSSSSSSGFDQYDVAGAGPSSDVTVRVVDPPRRPHSGIWFMLQASQNQDGRMTVRLLLKYLVSKLRLESESEVMHALCVCICNATFVFDIINVFVYVVVVDKSLCSHVMIEIRCRGQQLLPFLTLQHVRDNIWSPRDSTRALLSDSSTSDHVMVLHYGRTTP
ncbi:unnamed protein product [Sphenostylis stenocarpa]|uniref:Uncharacterized protein n=1 Tax=Sphenostylis stenocarpa TaxID=92480 RepID=A0AA86RNB3_9FABA|nr:unnamed protein product [Sphenostylis stenocarpa]